jgi:hypothetical protein
MSKAFLMKVGAVILLVAALLVMPSSQRQWYTYALLLFGLINIFLDSPGTTLIRTLGVIAAFVALVWQDKAALWATLLLWLIWPPAFMVSWALAKNPRSREPEQSAQNVEAERAQIALSVLIAAVAIGSVAYRLLVRGGLQQTAALFIGIPAILAIVVVSGVSPRSATGVACKAVTVGLLVSLMVLGEGMLCIVMSAPLFYLVAIVIGQTAEAIQRRRNRQTTLLSSVLLLAFVPMTLEGVLPFTTINRNDTVRRSKVVNARSESVQNAMHQQPRFDRKLPLYLRIGYPRPTSTKIDNTPNGTRCVIRFRGGEMRITGMEPQAGDLVLILEEERAGYIRWRAISDTSHMTHFLRWREITAEWSPVDAENSQVTWTIQYERGLDPAWYFGPMEHYAVGLAADYLIDSVATP